MSESIYFTIGLLIGYYVLSPSFRGIANQILYRLAQILHHAVLWSLGAIVTALSWCYSDTRKPVENRQGKMIQGYPVKAVGLPSQPPKTVAPKVDTGGLSHVKTKRLEDGSTVFILTPEKLDELMAKNPDLKITEKEED